MATKTYFVQTAGWVMGENRRAGDKVEATEEEAKFALLSGTLADTAPPTKAEQKAALAAANKVEDSSAPKRSSRKSKAEKAVGAPPVEKAPESVMIETVSSIGDGESVVDSADFTTET